MSSLAETTASASLSELIFRCTNQPVLYTTAATDAAVADAAAAAAAAAGAAAAVAAAVDAAVVIPHMMVGASQMAEPAAVAAAPPTFALG